MEVAIVYFLFRPIFTAKSLIFPYAVHPFDICKVYPETWKKLKIAYFVVDIIAESIVTHKLLRKLTTRNQKKEKYDFLEDFSENNEICLTVGTNENSELVKIQEKGLYQNIFINSAANAH